MKPTPQGRDKEIASLRAENERLKALLLWARDRIPDWTTGVNRELIETIQTALTINAAAPSREE